MTRGWTQVTQGSRVLSSLETPDSLHLHHHSTNNTDHRHYMIKQTADNNVHLASFPGLSFECLQHAKMGGPFHYVNDISVYLGRQRGRSNERTSFRLLLVQFLNVREGENLLFAVQYEERMRKIPR